MNNDKINRMTAKEYYKSSRMVETRNWTLEMALNFAEEYTEALRIHDVVGQTKHFPEGENPESVSVQQALLKVWNETAQEFNLTDEDRLKRSDKLWKKLVKELSVLQDDNFTARQLFDYVERHYCQPPREQEELRIGAVISWVAASEKLPSVQQNGNKVLIYRIMNDSQESLAISIHETSMVKYCNVDETWWMELPKPPCL